MASKKTLTTAVEVDTDRAQRNLKELGDTAEKTGRDLKDAGGDTETLERATKDAAVDVDRLADELRNTGKVTQEFGDDTKRVGDRIEDTYDTVESGAMGTASSIGEAFGEGGDIQSGLGSAAEAVESFAEMFGPAGLIVSFIGGAAIGALTRFLDKSNEVSEEVKARAADIADALLEMNGKLTDAYAEEQILEWIKTNGAAYDAITRVEGGVDKLTAVYKGDKVALNQLVRQLEELIRTDEAHLQAIKDKVAETGYATKAQQRDYQQTKQNISATKESIAAITDEASGIRTATETYQRQEGYLNRNTEMKNRNAAASRNAADEQRRLATAAYDANSALRQGGVGGTSSRRPSSNAGGGPIAAGEPSWVGEYGKELFVPDTAGTIVPQHDLRRGGGGGTVVVNVTTNDPDRMAVKTAQALRRAQFRQGR